MRGGPGLWRRMALLAGLGLGLGLGFGQGLAWAADPNRGSELYRAQCAQCHGAAGRPVAPLAPDFTRPTALLKPDLVLLQAIRAGKGAMPAYQGVLRDREILDVVAYLRTFK